MGRFTDPVFRFLSKACHLNIHGITEKTPREICLRWSLFVTSQERRVLLSFLKWKTDEKGADGSWANACRQGLNASGQPITQEQVIKAREDALAKLGYEWDGMQTRPRRVFRETNSRFQKLIAEIIAEYGRNSIREEALDLARQATDVAQLRVLELEEQLETQTSTIQGVNSEIEELRATVLNSFDFSPDGLERLHAILAGQLATLADERHHLAVDRPRLEKEIERLKEQADACGHGLSKARTTEESTRQELALLTQCQDAKPKAVIELAQVIQTALGTQTQMTRDIELLRPTIRQCTERLEASLPRLSWLDRQISLTQEWSGLVGRTRERLCVVRLPQVVTESTDLPTYLPTEALPHATPQSQSA